MKPTVQINMRLDVDFYEAMEKARGEKSRTAFIRDAIAKEMQYEGELPVENKKARLAPASKPVEKKTAVNEHNQTRPQKPKSSLEAVKEAAGLTTAAELDYQRMCPEPTCLWRALSPAAKSCGPHSRPSIPYDAEKYAEREAKVAG